VKAIRPEPFVQTRASGLACQRASLLRVSGTDTQRMFAARNRLLVLVEDRPRAAHVAERPCSRPWLPAGPARAAIVVHAQGASRCFSIVVRSLRDGLGHLRLEGEDLREDSGWAVALDASLSASMGILLDEMLVDRRPETCAARRAAARDPRPPDVPTTIAGNRRTGSRRGRAG
jgi:hypothetical protein